MTDSLFSETITEEQIIHDQVQDVIKKINEYLVKHCPLLEKGQCTASDVDIALVNITYSVIDKNMVSEYASWFKKRYRQLEDLFLLFIQGYNMDHLSESKLLKRIDSKLPEMLGVTINICKCIWDYYFKNLAPDDKANIQTPQRVNHRLAGTVRLILNLIDIKFGISQVYTIILMIMSLGAIVGGVWACVFEPTNHTDTPVIDETAQPVIDETAQPVIDETAQPVIDETAQPVIDETVPAVINETVPAMINEANSAEIKSPYDEITIKKSKAVELNKWYGKPTYENSKILLGFEPGGDDEYLHDEDDLCEFTGNVTYYINSNKMVVEKECAQSWYEITLYENKKEPYKDAHYWIDGDYIYKPALQLLVCELESTVEITTDSTADSDPPIKGTIISGYAKNTTTYPLLPLGNNAPQAIYTDIKIAGEKYRFDPRYQDATGQYIFFLISGDYSKLIQYMKVKGEGTDSLLIYGKIENKQFTGNIYSVKGESEPASDHRKLPENNTEKYLPIGKITFSVADS